MTLSQYAKVYFRQSTSLPGCEAPKQFYKRLHETKDIRMQMAGGKKRAQLLSDCAVFRNQLFIAYMQGGVGDAWNQVKASATKLEEAYQTSEDLFLQVCEVEKQTALGQEFSTVRFAYSFMLF